MSYLLVTTMISGTKPLKNLPNRISAYGAGNLFELLSKEEPQEDVEEAIRACKRLSVHLRGLVEGDGRSRRACTTSRSTSTH